MKQLSMLLGLVLWLTPMAWAQADDAFPGRPKYPDVRVMELADLQKQLNDVVVVDVRSEFEYHTLRIKGSINIPVASRGFVKDVANIRVVTKKPIVFYCNGHTCMKSYKATRKANLGKVTNCYAYDSGIFDWAKANPQNTELLGKAPLNLTKLISKQQFKAHSLKPQSFEARVEGKKDVLILDVRDRFQRAGVGLFPFQETWLPLDQFAELDRRIELAKRKNRTLYIYDEVGKQVRWLQYRLERAGLKKYYFMEGGSKAYFESL